MPDDNHDLVAALRGGAPGALEQLFTQYEPRLRKLVLFRIDNRLKRRLDVDDLLQEAWLAISQRLPHFLKQPDQASCYVWMRLVTAQTMTDLHRRHLGTKARDAAKDLSFRQASPNATSQSIADFLVARGTSPTGAVARAEAADQIREAVADMEPTDQEILALRHFEELTNAEVAEILGITGAAASTRYIRALKKLQEVLSRFPDFAH